MRSSLHLSPPRAIPPATLLVAPAAELAATFAAQMEQRARQAVHARGRFAFAFPGGSVAHVLLPALGMAGLPWTETLLFQIDERAVPPDAAESNAALARAMLAGTPAIDRARWFPMHGVGDLDAAARAYARTLTDVLGTPPALDVALLGVGEDGHVASLFPGHTVAGEWVAAVDDAPKPPAARLTLTYATLRAARTVYVVALGMGKASIARALRGGTGGSTPAARVLAEAREAFLLLDEAAASTPAV